MKFRSVRTGRVFVGPNAASVMLREYRGTVLLPENVIAKNGKVIDRLEEIPITTPTTGRNLYGKQT